MQRTATSYIRPHRPVAERVICSGDPGRALRLAQDLCEGVPAMLNHHRGLWGYSGTGADGLPLTVQATGAGGPSAAAVVADLLALGARRIVRVGTGARASAAAPPLGALVTATSVQGRDGTSRALGAPEELVPDGELLAALATGADAAVTVASADVWTGAAGDAPVRDLQSAALLAVAGASAAAAVVLVLDRDAGGGRLPEEALLRAEARAGRLALAALA